MSIIFTTLRLNSQIQEEETVIMMAQGKGEAKKEWDQGREGLHQHGFRISMCTAAERPKGSCTLVGLERVLSASPKQGKKKMEKKKGPVKKSGIRAKTRGNLQIIRNGRGGINGTKKKSLEKKRRRAGHLPSVTVL